MAGEKAISYTLRNSASVQAYCGTPPDSAVNPRIWLGQRRQGSILPAVTVELDTTYPTDTKDGASGLDNDYVFVYTYATTAEIGQVIAETCRQVIDKAISGTILQVRVQSVQFISRNYFQDGEDPLTHVYEDRYKVRVLKP